jgi:hypothetical protein
MTKYANNMLIAAKKFVFQKANKPMTKYKLQNY